MTEVQNVAIGSKKIYQDYKQPMNPEDVQWKVVNVPKIGIDGDGKIQLFFQWENKKK